MEIGYVTLSLVLAGFVYATFMQIKDYNNVRAAVKPTNFYNKRILYGNVLLTFAYIGFTLSMGWNVLNGSSSLWLVFLALLVISKFLIIPKDSTPRLKSSFHQH
ncbi:hypothetical protein [Planococcus sp. YIM B11945]|uniref:hypothetical protein n=1 Tax=Planococcus sp. YIM B11945 TaxID=3435410 RepID=UPI003D7DB6CF